MRAAFDRRTHISECRLHAEGTPPLRLTMLLGRASPRRSTRPSRQRSGCRRPPAYTALCEAKAENKQRQPLPSGGDIATEEALRRTHAMDEGTRTCSKEPGSSPVLFPAG